MMGNVAVFCLAFLTGFPAAIESEVGLFLKGDGGRRASGIDLVLIF